MELMRHDRISGCLVPSPPFLQIRDIALAMITEQYEVNRLYIKLKRAVLIIENCILFETHNHRLVIWKERKM